MKRSMMSNFTDIGDSYCEGDPLPGDIDWAKVEHLKQRYDQIQAIPEGEERNLKMAELLQEMHGDGLKVL
jgi:hypothetical protein